MAFHKLRIILSMEWGLLSVNDQMSSKVISFEKLIELGLQLKSRH